MKVFWGMTRVASPWERPPPAWKGQVQGAGPRPPGQRDRAALENAMANGHMRWEGGCAGQMYIFLEGGATALRGKMLVNDHLRWGEVCTLPKKGATGR